MRRFARELASDGHEDENCNGSFFGGGGRLLPWLCELMLFDVMLVLLLNTMGMEGDVVGIRWNDKVDIRGGDVLRARDVCCQQIAARGVE